MKSKSVLWLSIACVILMNVFSGLAAEDPVTVDEVVKMLRDGRSETDIAQAIRDRGCRCQTSAFDVMVLKGAGASDELLRAMREEASRPQSVQPAAAQPGRAYPQQQPPRNQEPKKTVATVFGGYSFGRTYGDTGEDNSNGWNAAVSVALTDWLAITGDASGHYFGTDPTGLLDANLHSFSIGPQFSTWGRTRRVRGFGHVLVGAANFKLGVFGVPLSETNLDMLVGGGLDVGVNEHLAVRVFQSDWLHVFGVFDDAQIDMVRLSFGLVGRF